MKEYLLNASGINCINRSDSGFVQTASILLSVYFQKEREMEILGISYGAAIAVGYGMFFYHNTGARKEH